MNKDRRDLIILGGITVVLIALLVLSAVKFKIDENSENKTNTNPNIQNSGTTKEENDITPTKTPTSPPMPTSTPSATPVPTKTPDVIIPTIEEDDVVNYFTSLETTSFTEDGSDLKEKCKNLFTTVVDFLFYDKEIKGYTFNELTTSTKLKIIKIALSIDNKIDKYFPDYKDTIKEKYTNLKGKAALLYLETTSKLCDSVGESACSEAREDFKNMKESFGFTWDLIKSGTSKGYNYLKEILDEWYQSIK